MSFHNYDYLLKLVLIGKYGSGKTSLLIRFTDEYFPLNAPQNLGIDFKLKKIAVENQLIKLQIWDVNSGCQRIRTPLEFESRNNGAHGFIFNYDITDVESFKFIKNAIYKYKTIENNMKFNVCKILLGNKGDDSKRCISEEEGRKLANENNMGFFETSAKNNININEAFEYLIKQILDKIKNNEIYKKGFLINKYREDLKKRENCFN